jgi:hypothetical protein
LLFLAKSRTARRNFRWGTTMQDIDALLDQMSLEEQVNLLAGAA